MAQNAPAHGGRGRRGRRSRRKASRRNARTALRPSGTSGGTALTYTPPRDLTGYRRMPPDPRWPDGARLALNFVLNYEEGAEYSLGEGDAHAETILSELAPAPAMPGLRNRNIESLYEYGAR